MRFSKARVDIIRNFLRYCNKSEEKIPPPSHVKYFNDFRIIVENPAGTQRFWTDHSTGEKGATIMLYDYGFFHGSRGADKDEVDVYLGPEEKTPMAYVVRQLKPDTGAFDEVKVFLGFTREQDVKEGYLKHYNKPGFYGGMTIWPVEKLRQALKDSIYDPSIIKGLIKD
jgi:hypothetical protein